MKPNKYSILLLSVFFLMQYHISAAQAESALQPVVKLHYFNNNNNVQYLILESMLKENKTLTPVKNKAYELYLDSSNVGTLIAKVKTDETGKEKKEANSSSRRERPAS